MTALPNNPDPVRKPLDEYGDIIASIGKGPQPITNRPHLKRANDLLSIMNGTATKEQIREHLIRVMEAEVSEQVNDQVSIDTGDDRESVDNWGAYVEVGGRFRFVSDERVTIELDGDAALGFYASGKQGIFSGEKSGCRWSGERVKWSRKGRAVEIVLDVESV